jgi:hypothetical protein
MAAARTRRTVKMITMTRTLAIRNPSRHTISRDPAEDDHRGSRDQRAIGPTPERTRVKGSGRLRQQAQKPKMLETQAETDLRMPPKTTTTFLRLLPEPPRTGATQNALRR